MTNRYVVNGLVNDMLDGKDIIFITTPLKDAVNTIGSVRYELEQKHERLHIKSASCRGGDAHITLAHLGSIRAASAISDKALRGCRANVWVIQRGNLTPDHFARLAADYKTAAKTGNTEMVLID